MPIFEYKCPDCSCQFEKIVFGEEQESVACPDCGSRNTEKLLSSFAVGAESMAKRESGLGGPCPCGAAQRGMCQFADD